jgi:hypothetical protein
VPQSVTKYQVNGVKQAWSIKNYRYVGDVSVPRIEELAGIGALRDGASALSKLGLVKTNQAALAKVLQLV